MESCSHPYQFTQLDDWAICRSERPGGIIYHDVWCPQWKGDPVRKDWNPFLAIEEELGHPWRKEVVEEPVPPGQMDYSSVYELTLTTTKDDPYELRQYLRAIVNSPMYDVVRWYACIELQANGNPHIHAVLYSNKKYCDGTKIDAVKNPKGKIKFPYRYEFKRVRNLEKYLLYIQKENGNPIIKEYCDKKGIPQLWDGFE